MACLTSLSVGAIVLRLCGVRGNQGTMKEGSFGSEMLFERRLNSKREALCGGFSPIVSKALFRRPVTLYRLG